MSLYTKTQKDYTKTQHMGQRLRILNEDLRYLTRVATKHNSTYKLQDPISRNDIYELRRYYY